MFLRLFPRPNTDTDTTASFHHSDFSLNMNSLGFAICMLCLIVSLPACQWGANTEDSEQQQDENNADNNDTDVDIDIDTEAGDIFDSEQTLHRFNLISFSQDSNDEKNSRYNVFFDNYQNASSSVEPDEKDDQRTNDLTLSQSTWEENLSAESYNLEWLTINAPYNSPSSNFSLARSYQTLQLSGENTGQLSSTFITRNYPLIEAVDDNIFERQLGVSFIWDLSGLNDGKKEENLSGQQFEEYSEYENKALLEQAEIWGDSKRFSVGAKLYSGIKKVNNRHIVVESLLENNQYSQAAASFDATGKTLIDLPLDYSNDSSARLSFPYTLNYIDNNKLYVSFDVATQRVFYHLNADTEAVASSPYRIDSALNLLELDNQNLQAINPAADDQQSLLNQLQLEAFFNLAVLGPFTDANNTDKFYWAKHYISSTEDNSSKQTGFFYFNSIAFEDIKNQFLNWREELLDDAF